MTSSFQLPIEDKQALHDGWTMAVLPAGSCGSPGDAAIAGTWITAHVPGTAAQSLREAELWSLDNPAPLHDQDIWYKRKTQLKAGSTLHFEGLATIAEVWIDGCKAALSENMFLPVTVRIEHAIQKEIAIVFRSLDGHLAAVKGKRARWRTSLVDNQALRFVRTTFLGHMPGWCPEVDIIGPFRSITASTPHTISADDIKLYPGYENGQACLEAEIHLPSGMQHVENLNLHCAGHSTAFISRNGTLNARLILPNIEPWWPHTHGKPMLYEVAVESNGIVTPVGTAGFRNVEIDTGTGGTRFGFIINGQKVFARGTCWTPSDIVTLQGDKESYMQQFRRMRDAGFNMVRILGITLYETKAFFESADELGLMVWQDLQFANFDYPFQDNDFHTMVEYEIHHLLRSTQSHCSLVLICGGSEIAQQAAMMGLPADRRDIPFLETWLPDLVRAHRPGIVCISNSPFGGSLPFSVNCGVAHYYGVGAYLRPLEDARRADVSFAAECLAFANVPDATSLRSQTSVPATDHPLWKSRVPRDRDASWDFEDVREHYMTLLYGVDCNQMRRDNPDRYLAFARAAPAEVMETTFSEWRRPQSRTSGGLVFLWKDFCAGAGWGLLDSTGRPKSVWYALQRICRPLQLLMTDEGVNGLHLHIINETSVPQNIWLQLECLAHGHQAAVQGKGAFHIAANSFLSLNACDLIGSFFDTNYAYRFGPPAHDIVVAQMLDARNGRVISEAFHFPLGRGNEKCETGLAVEVTSKDGNFALVISCNRFAQTIEIDLDDFIPDENYFHLKPGMRKTVALRRTGAGISAPAGTLSALNSLNIIHF